MRPAGKWLATAIAAVLVLVLLVAPLINSVLAAYDPTEGWSQEPDPGMGNQRAVADAWVIKDGGTYRMWYTRVSMSESLVQILTRAAGVGIPGLTDAVLEFRLNDLLNGLAAIDGTDLANLLGTMTSVIGYATSNDGVDWTVQNNTALAGGTTLLDAVGSPVVIKDSGTYRMWYTRLETDFDAAGLATVLGDLDAGTPTRQAAIQSIIAGCRTVIAYATSSNGSDWTVQSPQVHPATDGNLFASVGAPSVIKDGTTYEMWYTRARTDLTPAQWATVLTDTAGYDIDALAGLLDGTAAVIGYATSSDGVNWTVQDNEVLAGAGPLWQSVGDPSVVKTGTSYEMWFTRADTDLNISSATALATEVNGLGLGGLWTTLLTGDYIQFLTQFIAKDLATIESLLGQTGTAIAYATSPDGAAWTVQQATDLAGATMSAWSSVAAPSVVAGAGGYEMWFTEGVPSLQVQSLFDLATGADFPIGFVRFSPPAPPPPGGGPPAPAPPPPGTTDLTGLVDETGVFQEEVVATSEDGLTQVSMPEGATGQTADGDPLTEITIVEMETPPAPPADGNIIGLVYEFGPDGATFDQPITLTFTYDPAQLPTGVDEADLTLAVWDDDAGEWVELPSVVDTDANTVSAQVDHFSSFTIAYMPAPAAFTVSGLLVTPPTVEEGGRVNVTVTVSNSGDLEGTYDVELKVNGQVVATEPVTLSGGESRDVPFTVTSTAIVGRHVVSVAGQSGSFTVTAKKEPAEPTEPEEPDPPTPEEPAVRAEIVTSNLSVAPVQVQVGETVIVSVLVTNRGDTEGTYEVVLRLGGSVVGSKTVTLATGTTRTVTFQMAPDRAGTFEVEIDSLSKSLTVKEIPVPTKPGVNPLLIGSIIAVSALVTAVVVVLVMRRRSEAL